LAQGVGAEGGQEQEPGNHDDKVALSKKGQMVAEEEKVGNEEWADEKQADKEAGIVEARRV
jgi:hypothetical protein